MKKSAVEEYEVAIRAMLALKGLKETNTANHLALKTRKISIEQFRAGARILAAEILKR